MIKSYQDWKNKVYTRRNIYEQTGGGTGLIEEPEYKGKKFKHEGKEYTVSQVFSDPSGGLFISSDYTGASGTIDDTGRYVYMYNNSGGLIYGSFNWNTKTNSWDTEPRYGKGTISWNEPTPKAAQTDKKTDSVKKNASEYTLTLDSPGTKVLVTTAFKDRAKGSKTYELLINLLNSVIPVVGASEFSAIPAGGAAQDEIDGGKTGENSVKFIKALIQTLIELKLIDTPTTASGKLSEEVIDRSVAEQFTKMMQVLTLSTNAEKASRFNTDFPGFVDIFKGKLKSVTLGKKTVSADLKDIKFPITANSDKDQITKVQQIILDYCKSQKELDTALSGYPDYKTFKSYGADGVYGGGTRFTVSTLKGALESNGKSYPNQDGNKIEQDFIELLLGSKIK